MFWTMVTWHYFNHLVDCHPPSLISCSTAATVRAKSPFEAGRSELHRLNFLWDLYACCNDYTISPYWICITIQLVFTFTNQKTYNCMLHNFGERHRHICFGLRRPSQLRAPILCAHIKHLSTTRNHQIYDHIRVTLAYTLKMKSGLHSRYYFFRIPHYPEYNKPNVSWWFLQPALTGALIQSTYESVIIASHVTDYCAGFFLTICLSFQTFILISKDLVLTRNLVINIFKLILPISM